MSGMSAQAESAVVLLVETRHGVRYFSGKSKGGRVVTAWSLAGAQLFGQWRPELEKAEELLRRRGYKVRRAPVGMLG